ncbi:MAG TPA: hypothetical protein PK179_02315 [Spirochaetales bacterium]|nr:hypothetical protein [Spirochaetales bacterium]
MPTLQDIERFKASLKTLGKEPETLERWGETWHDLEAPPQGVPDDIADLLQSDDAALGDAALGDAALGDAFSSFLDDIPLGDDQVAEPAPTDDFELPGGFGEESSPAGPPERETDDFTVPDSLLEDFGSLLETEEATEAAPTDDAPTEEPIEPIEPIESLEATESETTGLDDFTVPDSLLDGAADETSQERPEMTGEAVRANDDFSFDDLESLESEGDSEAAKPDDGFSIPAFDDMGLAEAEPEAPGSGEAAAPGPDPEARGAESAGFDLGSESMEGDSFDQFDLGGGSPEVAVPEMGDSDFGGEFSDLGSESAAADTFSLGGDWGGDFTIPGFEMGNEVKPTTAKPAASKEARPGKAPSSSLAGAFGSGEARVSAERKARPVELTENQADALQDTLLSYPLNLRLAIEDIVANQKGTELQQSDLVWLLVERASAKDAAKLAGKVLKRYIEVPASFAKRTGAAFEAEKGSFRYLLVHSILPVLQVLLLVAAGAGAAFYLGYNFAYKPIKAYSLYAEGHRQIGLSQFGESLELFERAEDEWSMKGWHYRYAEAYADAGQYPRAEAMYERLLARWPKEKRAAKDYATMEMDLLSFDTAEKVLQTYILSRDYFDKDALLLSARNLLAWADFEEQGYDPADPAEVARLYEKARLQLATLMERHGRSDGYLELMLIYLMRTERASGSDKSEDALPLAKYFVENNRSAWAASTLAELAEYLLDRDETEYVNRILLSAVDRDGTVPETHAAMARWNRRSGFPKDELKALEFAARFYAEADARSGLAPKRVKGYIDSMMRLGELRRQDGRGLDAEEAFNIAIDRYERALTSRQLRRDARFGRAYSLLADIYYAERMDFDGALELYAKAEANGFTSPQTDYRRGYIHYLSPKDDGSAALRFFYRAGLDLDASPYLQWATANALYQRDDYFAAQGYLSTLANRLQFELDTITLPSPQTKPSHSEVVELLMMTRNNLGATLYRVAERMGDTKRRAEAMVEFTESAKLYDSLARDQASMVRPESKNLGFLNLDFILHPQRGMDLVIYKAIPVEMDYPRK